MERPQLKRIIEAALLASAQPLSLPQISGLFDKFDMPSHDDLAKAMEELQADAAGRGIELVEVASGFRYQVCRDVHAFVSRLWTERQSRYSRALLETLSLIAYRQPITRAEIEQIRGVAVSTNIVRTLEERDWVRVVGYRDLPGKPALFGTTKQFLDYFSLKSLDELPPLSEIRDIEEFDPQLDLDERRAIPANLGIDDTAGEISANDADAESPMTDDDVADASPASSEEEPPVGTAQEDTPESIA
jgi:segregation and condensation protein B